MLVTGRSLKVMPYQRNLVARYVMNAALPYVFLSLLLLTGVLFAQQAGHFAELAVYTQVPLSLFGELATALLPGVLVFTLPIAVLAGIIIGFARMGSDSEIVAMRAAGVGTWSMLWPMLLIGLVVSGATTYLHMKEAPRAARDIRRASLLGALRKLDSPVEPRTFNTEIPGYIIYVRDGNKAQGLWGRVFIYSYSQEPDGSVNVVTARSGRIDSSVEQSELVLNDAIKAKIPAPGGPDQRSFVVERLDQLRIAINTGRTQLLDQLNKGQTSPDELGWSELKRRAYFSQTAEESLGKIGTVSPAAGAWLATGVMALLGLLFLTLNRRPLDRFSFRRVRFSAPPELNTASRSATRNSGIGGSGFPSLLDISIFRSLTVSFAVGFASLVSLFIIFTLFELWRFIAVSRVGLALVARYTLFLLPLITVEIFPATMLIAVLMTYALLARRSEAIAWWASGQSVYRLMLPGLVFALAAGSLTWLVQEHLMPSANVRQDALRSQIKGGEARAVTGTGRQWLASGESNRLYSYEFNEREQTLEDPAVYEFDAEGVHLVSVTTASTGLLTQDNRMVLKDAETLNFRGMGVEREIAPSLQIRRVEPLQVFKPTIDRPSQLSALGLSGYLKTAKRRGVEVSALALALQRKYAGPFNVLVMAFIGMPLALSFGRRGAVIALCVAVGVSSGYWAVGGGFQQLGNHGLLPPAVAAWSPPIIFAAAGTYFLSKIRT